MMDLVEKIKDLSNGMTKSAGGRILTFVHCVNMVLTCMTE
jgi:hypothetical protein